MGFTDGKILLNGNGTYYPGETIIGKVVFNEGKAKTCRGIYLIIRGFCKVRWTVHHHRSFDDVYESYEEYIHEKLYLIGSGSGKTTLAPGHYEFPFQLELPSNLPSSFESTVGHVRYGLNAILDRAYKFNQELKAHLMILPYIDLNMNPHAKTSLNIHMEDIYCCWCVVSGSSEVQVKMPTAGFCVGQTIPVEISCANNSSVKIKNIRISIKTNTEYIATSLKGKKLKTENLLELSKGPVPAHSSKTWATAITLPQMTLYNMNACRYINIDHIFKVTVVTSGCHTNNENEQKIIIGNVPLQIVVPNHPTAPYEQLSNVSTSAPNPSYYSSDPPPYPGGSTSPRANLPSYPSKID